MIFLSEGMKMKKLIAISMTLILFGFSGCNDAGRADEDQPKVEVPKVDLHSAVVTDDLDVIRQHVKAGSDLNVLEPSRASTPLISAAAFGKTEAAKILIDGGASINYQYADGSTALHTACVFGTTDAAKLLIDSGAELDIKNKEGSAPIHIAAFFGHTEIVKSLLEKGADKNIKNAHGQTAYEIVSVPFEDIRFIYDATSKAMRPLGVVMDYEKIKEARPVIAEMLK
jgi:ankyrin repeat protein